MICTISLMHQYCKNKQTKRMGRGKGRENVEIEASKGKGEGILGHLM